MLMAHSSLLQAIKEHSESIFKHANPIAGCCISMLRAACSRQFCLKKHSGNVEILSQARGPSLTGTRLQHPPYETACRRGEVQLRDMRAPRLSFWGLSRSELNELKKSFEFDIMLIK